MRVTPLRIMTTSLLLLGVLAVVCLLSLTTGPAKLRPGAVLAELFGSPGALDAMERTILMRVRLPRVLLGQRPSLRNLRRRWLALVRLLRRCRVGGGALGR